MQKIIDLSIHNEYWENPNYFCEEQFSGLSVTFRVTRQLNIIEANERKIHHCFQQYRDLPIYDDLRETIFSAVITAPEGLGRKYIKTLIDSGVMGAEKIQHQNGEIRLVLTDLLMLRGIDMSQFSFRDRRIYLENLSPLLLERKLVPNIVISDIIKTEKFKFYEFICDRGARGVILKNANGFPTDRVFKVPSRKMGTGVGNVTLNRNWQALEKKPEPIEVFDFDTFLAVQALNKPIKEKLLSSIT